MTLSFVVWGIPQPQGSARAFTYRRSAEKGGGFGARVDTDNPKLKAWRRDVGRAARQAHQGAAIAGPMRLCVDFYLPRPKALKTKARPHVTRPDTDKLLRGVCDALTAIVWADDAQVVQVKATKQYAPVHGAPCAVIAVSPLDDGHMTPLLTR